MFAFLRTLSDCCLCKALCLLLFLWLAGCARLPVTGNLPDGATLETLARIDPGAPFAADPEGGRVALVRDGLRILDPASGEQLLSAESPAALAWADDGKRLAAAFAHGGGTLLKIFAGGRVEREAEISGRVDRLDWHPETGLFAAATTLEVYSFGANYKAVLYRWQGEGAPLATPLHDVTLKPLTLHNWGEHLYRTVRLEISPFGDEILYTRLHDPPAFSPYLKIVQQHLETGAEREVAHVALTSGGAVHAADETVLYGDGMRRSRRVDPWTASELQSWPTAGRTLAISRGGRYLLLDGRLYRDGAEIAAFPAGSEGRFSSGGRLFLRVDRRLYRLSGLEEDPTPALAPAVRDRLRKLRKWRSDGLISHDEYLRQKQRMTER